MAGPFPCLFNYSSLVKSGYELESWTSKEVGGLQLSHTESCQMTFYHDRFVDNGPKIFFFRHAERGTLMWVAFANDARTRRYVRSGDAGAKLWVMVDSSTNYKEDPEKISKERPH